MTDAAIKQQKRRLIETVIKHFGMTSDATFYLDGNPFDLEFCDGFQTWKIRCVSGAVSQLDRNVVENIKLNPVYFRKGIAFRPSNGQKDFELIEIK